MTGQVQAATQTTGRPLAGLQVAVVEDDAELRDLIVSELGDHGVLAVGLDSAEALYRHLAVAACDVVMLDVMLPGEDGYTVVAHLRRSSEVGIVMLTGRGDETDKIIGLETGADDYMMKPFNPRELIARLRAVLRRAGRATPQAPDRSGHQLRSFGQMRLDQTRRELLGPDGSEIALTNAEYRLLDYFLRHPDRIIPRPDLLRELGNDLSLYMDRTIDVLILRLRRKIEPVPSKPIHLQTRRGQGYIFVTAP